MKAQCPKKVLSGFGHLQLKPLGLHAACAGRLCGSSEFCVADWSVVSCFSWVVWFFSFVCCKPRQCFLVSVGGRGAGGEGGKEWQAFELKGQGGAGGMQLLAVVQKPAFETSPKAQWLGPEQGHSQALNKGTANPRPPRADGSMLLCGFWLKQPFRFSVCQSGKGKLRQHFQNRMGSRPRLGMVSCPP